MGITLITSLSLSPAVLNTSVSANSVNDSTDNSTINPSSNYSNNLDNEINAVFGNGSSQYDENNDQGSQPNVDLSSEQMRDIVQNNSNYSYDSNSDEHIITISDSQMRNILLKEGYSDSQLGLLGMSKSEGYTAMKWHGSMSKGNVDIYLSKTTLQATHFASMNSGVVMAVVYAYTGNYVKAGMNAFKAIENDLHMSSTSDGKVFVVRNWTNIHSYKQ